MRRALAAALMLVVLTACGGSGDDGDTQGYVGTGAGDITVVDPADRQTAPTLSGPDLDGQELSTDDWSGQTIVVNVWGPWCAPCREEMPVLKQVAEDYADKDVQFVGILNKSNEARAKAFNEKIGVTYPSFADQGGVLELKFNDSLPTVAVPTTWIIDPQGRVAVRIAVNDLTESTLSGLIDDVQNS